MPPPSKIPFPSEPETSFLTKRQVLVTTLVTLAASLLYFLPDFPFHRGLCLVALASGLIHLGLFLIFDRVGAPLWNAVNLINIALMGFTLHFTGGILSPFLVFLFFIFISGAGYGVNYLLSLSFAAGTFLAVVGLEASGIVSPIPVNPQAVYDSPLVALLVVVAIVSHLITAGTIYRSTVKHLWAYLQAEHEKAQAMLRRLSALEAPSQLGILVSRINHEIRGPLKSVGGFVESVRQEPGLPEEAKRDCRVMIGEIERISGLLDRMLQYARPGEARKEFLDPAKVMDTVLSVLSFHPAAKNVKIVNRMKGGIEILANREELQQVYFNILKNSVEALEKIRRPRIEVDMRRQDGEVRVSIRDNGPGMPREILEKVSTASLSTKTEGTGLGLLIAREIVEAYGGGFSLESAEGGGTSVTLSFPLAPASREEKAATA